jgi:hypothetical protein
MAVGSVAGRSARSILTLKRRVVVKDSQTSREVVVNRESRESAAVLAQEQQAPLGALAC